MKVSFLTPKIFWVLFVAVCLYIPCKFIFYQKIRRLYKLHSEHFSRWPKYILLLVIRKQYFGLLCGMKNFFNKKRLIAWCSNTATLAATLADTLQLIINPIKYYLLMTINVELDIVMCMQRMVFIRDDYFSKYDG